MRRVILVLISFFVLLTITIYSFVTPYVKFFKSISNLSVTNFLIGKGVNPPDEQINFILLGRGGGSHEGADLTDSIQVGRLDLTTGKIRLLGIPRDIWIDSAKDKINTLYTYAEKKQLGSGLTTMQTTIGQLVGLDFEFTAMIDFAHFSELIDTLGGVDVDVKTAFTDTHYPISGKENDTCDGDLSLKCRFTTISFTTGMTHMDGSTALSFVRSRYADSDEGNDFARLSRQQIVIEAIIRKLHTYLATPSIDKITRLYGIVDRAIIRNIDNDFLLIIARKLFTHTKNIKVEKVTFPDDFFYFPPLGTKKYQGKYVLLPKNDDFSSLATISACLLTRENCL